MSENRLQYIVEWRPANAGEHYLFTQKGAIISELKAPPILRNADRPPGSRTAGTIRPVIVGTINPDTGVILYLADQEVSNNER